MEQIRVLMVDDHGLFRESLGRLLDTARDMAVVGQCATVGEAFGELSQSDPDVILLDYDLGEESGLSLLAELQAPGQQCPRSDGHRGPARRSGAPGHGDGGVRNFSQARQS